MTYRGVLRDHAQGQYGFVTTHDAAELHVPGVELRKLAGRGGLEKIAYGLYRVPEVAHTPLDQFAEAVLRVGPDAYLTHDAVLALHGLANATPTVIRVGTPHRVRTKLPRHIKVIPRDLPDDALTFYEGIRCTTVAQALIDCRGLVMTERLQDAVRKAAREGLLEPRETVRVRRRLRVTTP
jgi:predicted transcriptional regulator of viral defense system